MGLFDWVMKGIGFESDDEGYTNQDEVIEVKENREDKEKVEEEKKPKKKKKKSWFGRKKKDDEDNELNINPPAYDLDQYNALKEGEEDSAYMSNFGSSSSYGGGYSSYGNGTASYGAKNFVFFNPSTYEEIKRLVEYLKQGEPAIVNLDKITENEAQRSLDFISGAACALGGKLQRITGNYFLVTPDGYNITKPSGQPQ